MTFDAQIDTIRTSFQQLAGGGAALRAWQAHYVDLLDAGHKAALAELTAGYAVRRRAVELTRQQHAATADAVLAQESAAIALRWQTARTSFGCDAGRWDDLAATPCLPPALDAAPAALRIGALQLPGDPGHWDLPALTPLLGRASLCIDARHSPAAATAGQALLQSILLRLVLTHAPQRVRLTLCEPGGAGSLLAGFLHLPAEQRGPRIFVRADEVAAELARLSEQITRIAQERLRNVYPTVEAYNAANPATAVPYRVLVIAGLHAGMDERLWATLLQVARTGPAAGVYLLATLDGLTLPPRNVVLDDLLALCTPLTFTAPDRLHWRDPELGEFSVTPDAPPPAAQMNAWLAAVSEGLAQAVTTLDFSQIAPSPARYWQTRSRDGLAIPIGLGSTGAVHTLQLGQGVVHHALVGGVTGSGKSNLLHVLITQLALTYAPDDLALYLMDFREGVEFQDYVDLPHARVVALESEREFALSVLERLQAEREARGELIKRHGAQFLADYVGASGRPLPRILLMIDEFQVLFAEEDALARRAGQILEDLTRRGRGFGIHVLLSSQTPAISGLYSRTLYEQMGLRVALRCTPQVSQAVLGEGNIAASQLTHAGQAIVNDGLGERSHNREVQVALLSPTARRAALTTVQALAAGRADPPTITFAAHAPARLEANPELLAALAGSAAPRTDAVSVWLGEPIAIKTPTAALLERYEAANLLVIGGDEEQALGLLVAAILSVASQRPPDQASFLIGDFSRPTARHFGLFQGLGLPHAVTVLNARQLRSPDAPPPDAPQAAPAEQPPGRRPSLFAALTPATPPAAGSTPLDRLEALIAARWAQMDAGIAPAGPETWLVLAGLHAWRDLRPVEFKLAPAAEQLLRIAERGPEVGVHTVAWADSFATLEQSFKRAGVAHFDHRAILRVGEGDSNQLLGSPVAARLADGRALYRFEGWALGEAEKFKPYPVPEAETLADLAARIRGRMAG